MPTSDKQNLNRQLIKALKRRIGSTKNTPEARKILDEIQDLISQGADINLEMDPDNHYQRQPLYEAILSDDPELADLLLENGADINTRYMGVPYIGHILDYRKPNNLKLLESFLKAGADVNTNIFMNQSGRENYTAPIHAAIDNLNIAAVRMLIEYGANLEQKDKSGFTPAQLIGEMLPGGTNEGHLRNEKKLKNDIKDLLDQGKKIQATQGKVAQRKVKPVQTKPTSVNSSAKPKPAQLRSAPEVTSSSATPESQPSMTEKERLEDIAILKRMGLSVPQELSEPIQKPTDANLSSTSKPAQLTTNAATSSNSAPKS